MSASRKVCGHDAYDPHFFRWSRMTCTAWDSKMVDHNQRMERTLCLWEVSIALYQRILFVKCCVFYATVCFVQILFFQTSWLSMTWKIKSLGGLTTTVSASTLKPALSKNLSSFHNSLHCSLVFSFGDIDYFQHLLHRLGTMSSAYL